MTKYPNTVINYFLFVLKSVRTKFVAYQTIYILQYLLQYINPKLTVSNNRIINKKKGTLRVIIIIVISKKKMQFYQ